MNTQKKTGLVLGGGGARGAYEIGVWQALREIEQPIDLVVGSSVGAINGAMVAQDAFDLALTLWKEIKPEMVIDASLIKEKPSPLRVLLETYIDEDVLRKSPIIYGLVAVRLPSMEPHHFFIDDIPRGRLVDYILASGALLPVFKPQDIDHAKYVDGGYADNVPVRMALERGAEKIIAVDLDSGIKKMKDIEKATDLTMIHSRWDLGSVLDFDSATAQRNLKLGYLDAMKALGFHQGTYYSFPGDASPKKRRESAEMAAKIFQVDPTIPYDEDIFFKTLATTVKTYMETTQKNINDSMKHIKDRKPTIDNLPGLLRTINNRTLTLLLAQQIKDKNLMDSLLAKPILTMFKEEAAAADYLVMEELV